MKKIISLVTVLVVLFSLSSVAYAGEVDSQPTNYKAAEKIVENANNRIDKTIEIAVLRSEKIVALYESGKITEAEKDAIIETIIDNLLDKTDDISAKAVDACARYGVRVECQLIEVVIDERSVMVDPLIIIGL